MPFAVRRLESLLYVAAEIELPAREADDAIKPRLHFRWQITTIHQPLGFGADRVESFHEVSVLQFPGIVGHGSRGYG
jgi:hypothetical protein